MPVSGPVPEQVLAFMAAATVFAVMLDVGLGIVPREFRWVSRHPAIVAKGLFSVLVAVPAIALLVARAFDVPRPAEIGTVLAYLVVSALIIVVYAAWRRHTRPSTLPTRR